MIKRHKPKENEMLSQTNDGFLLMHSDKCSEANCISVKSISQEQDSVNLRGCNYDLKMLL